MPISSLPPLSAQSASRQQRSSDHRAAEGQRLGAKPQVPNVPPAVARWLSLATLACVTLIVLTGGAVRVTGSGLGCSDWPNCAHGNLTPPLQYHSLIEFGNRMVTVALVVIIAATFLAAWRRLPLRRDLLWLSGALVIGVFGEAVLGGIVVYTKLNPYWVMVHFLLTMAMVATAVVLFHRSGRTYRPGTGRLLVPRPVLLLARGMLVFLGAVLMAGSATTGAAPDAGGAVGQLVAKRIPASLRDVTELHASLALLLVGAVIALAVALHALDVPERVRHAARVLTTVLVAQAAIGYIQYFTHLPAILVEAHELGATVLVIGAVFFFLALRDHPRETMPARSSPAAGLRAAGAFGASGGRAGADNGGRAGVRHDLVGGNSGGGHQDTEDVPAASRHANTGS